ncbi:hypothetical protein V6N00_13895 [Tersicoccus sp. MR15.9]|uniref:hypothetical protein n=1 Tax=Tersicoccus mangrovi TaxID=3121635 RepID=UPI002FE539C7
MVIMYQNIIELELELGTAILTADAHGDRPVALAETVEDFEAIAYAQDVEDTPEMAEAA